jgi:hypothetical protein
MATREPSVELFYDPAELDPDAPRLHIRKDDGVWELRDAGDALLSSHAKLPEAIDAALGRSRVCFSEILVRGAVSPIEWSVRLNSGMAELARALNQPDAAERDAAASRRNFSGRRPRVDVSVCGAPRVSSGTEPFQESMRRQGCRRSAACGAGLRSS